MSQICTDRRCPGRGRASASRGESGQAALMMLAVVAVMLACAAVLFAFGNALGAKGGISARPSSRRSAPLR